MAEGNGIARDFKYSKDKTHGRKAVKREELKENPDTLFKDRRQDGSVCNLVFSTTAIKHWEGAIQRHFLESKSSIATVVTVKIPDNKVTVCIHSSGKCVVLGNEAALTHFDNNFNAIHKIMENLSVPASQPDSPEVKTKTPEVKTKTPGAKPKTPGAKPKTPEVKTKTPGAKTKTPEVKTKTPGAKTKTPGAKTKTPGAKTKTPGAKPKTSGINESMKNMSLEHEPDSPEVKTKTPEVKTKTPKEE